MNSKTFSPAYIARILGVSESTIKRWVDVGYLHAEKTPGGHRKITIPALLAFARARGRPVPSPEALELLGNQAIAPSGNGTVPEALGGLLLSGDIQVARTIILEQYVAGRPIDDLLDRLVGPAMAQVGTQWAEEEIEIYEEHAATQRILTILYELLRLLPVAPEGAPLALGGAPDGDPYLLPTLMAELTLSEMGWRTINLGPDTPVHSLLEAIVAYNPRLVWLSITSVELRPVFFEDYPRLFEAAQTHGVRIMIGGHGATADIQDRLVASAFGTRLAHLKAFAQALAG